MGISTGLFNRFGNQRVVGTDLEIDILDGTISVDEVNNRVGIGDTSPGTKLQVTDAAPYVTLKNSTAENSEGGCESRVIFEDHADATLAQIEGSHSGASDDTKGKLIFSTHTGSSLTTALTIDDEQATTLAGDLNVGGGDISGPTDGSLTIKADTDLIFKIDSDNDGTETFQFQNGAGTEIAALTEAGNLQIDGDLQVSGNNIVDNGGSAGISFDGSGNTQVDGDLTVNGGDIQYSNGQNATMSIAAVSGTNTAGKSLTISGGQSTGNAAGGNIVFQSSAAGASGSSANSLATVFTIENDGDIVVPGDIEMTDDSAIVDPNNSKLLKFCSVGSAVNYVEIENAADGTAPAISVLGDSTNITMSLKPKGTGGVRIFGSTAAAASLLLNEDSDNGTNFMKFQAAANIASNHTYTWPAGTPAGDSILKTNSGGDLSWVDEPAAPNDLNLNLHMQVFS